MYYKGSAEAVGGAHQAAQQQQQQQQPHQHQRLQGRIRQQIKYHPELQGGYVEEKDCYWGEKRW